MTDKLDAARALIGLTAPIEKTCPAPQRPPPTLLAKELAETPSNTLLTPPSTSTAGGKQRQELKGELLRGKRRPARAIVTARRKKLIELVRQQPSHSLPERAAVRQSREHCARVCQRIQDAAEAATAAANAWEAIASHLAHKDEPPMACVVTAEPIQRVIGVAVSPATAVFPAKSSAICAPKSPVESPDTSKCPATESPATASPATASPASFPAKSPAASPTKSPVASVTLSPKLMPMAAPMLPAVATLASRSPPLVQPQPTPVLAQRSTGRPPRSQLPLLTQPLRTARCLKAARAPPPQCHSDRLESRHKRWQEGLKRLLRSASIPTNALVAPLARLAPLETAIAACRLSPENLEQIDLNVRTLVVEFQQRAEALLRQSPELSAFL